MDEIRKLSPKEFPLLLREINDPPKSLYLRGKLPEKEHKYLCVVGSRKYTNYGRDVTEKLISGLSGHPVVIVSGLALGIDALAHKAALSAGLKTLAVPGSGLDDKVLYPKSNFRLARKILESGAMLSEFEPGFKATPWSFPQRNRIMAGLSHATLIIEASDKSGTLITARLSMEYNRDILVVPGPIFRKSHEGSNRLLVDGARPITESNDILDSLGINYQDTNSKSQLNSNLELSNEEKQVVEILEVEPLSKSNLLEALDMPITKANILLSTMELKGLIKESLGKIKLDS